MELGLFDRAPGFRSEVGGRCSRSMVIRFPCIRGRDPVVHSARNDPDRVRRFRLLPNRNQELGAVTLLRVGEGFDLIESRFVQVNVLPERCHIAGLFADDLRGRVLDDSGAMLIGPVRRTHEILRRLADSPDAGIAFARGAKQLHDNACKNRGFKKRPALVEQNDARLAGHARGAIGGRMGDEQAHGPLQAGIVLQLLDVEVEPGVVQLDRRGPIEQSGIRPFIDPGAQLGRGHLSHRIDLLIAIAVLPVREFGGQIPEERNRVRGLRAATFISGSDCFEQYAVEKVDVEIGRRVLAQHVPG